MPAISLGDVKVPVSEQTAALFEEKRQMVLRRRCAKRIPSGWWGRLCIGLFAVRGTHSGLLPLHNRIVFDTFEPPPEPVWDPAAPDFTHPYERADVVAGDLQVLHTWEAVGWSLGGSPARFRADCGRVDAAVLVYSVGSRASFEGLRWLWAAYRALARQTPPGLVQRPIMVVAAKADLPAADWAVPELEGRAFADAIGAMFAAVSARDSVPRALAQLRAQMVVWSLAFLLKLDRDGRGPTHVWEPVRWDWVDRPLPAPGTSADDAGPPGGVSWPFPPPPAPDGFRHGPGPDPRGPSAPHDQARNRNVAFFVFPPPPVLLPPPAAAAAGPSAAAGPGAPFYPPPPPVVDGRESRLVAVAVEGVRRETDRARHQVRGLRRDLRRAVAELRAAVAEASAADDDEAHGSWMAGRTRHDGDGVAPDTRPEAATAASRGGTPEPARLDDRPVHGALRAEAGRAAGRPEDCPETCAAAAGGEQRGSARAADPDETGSEPHLPPAATPGGQTRATPKPRAWSPTVEDVAE